MHADNLDAARAFANHVTLAPTACDIIPKKFSDQRNHLLGAAAVCRLISLPNSRRSLDSSKIQATIQLSHLIKIQLEFVL